MELGKFIDLSQNDPKPYKNNFHLIQSIKMLCPTRWTMPAEIHNGQRDEYGMKAGGFLQSLDKFIDLFWTKVFIPCVLSCRTTIYLFTLQSNNTTIQDTVLSANLAVQRCLG